MLNKKVNNKKNFILTLFSSSFGVVTTIVVGFLTAPISLGYWKSEKYAILSIIISVMAYLAVSSLGLNSAAANLMAKNKSFKDKMLIFKRSFLFLLVAVLLFSSLFVSMDYLSPGWAVIFGKVKISIKAEVGTAAFIFGVFFFINLPFSLFTSAFIGFQRVYIDKAITSLNTLFNFFMLLLVIYLKGTLVDFALLTGISNLLISIIRALFFYFFVYRKANRNFKKYDNKQVNEETTYNKIFTTGIKVFFINLAAMVIWNTDNLVISHFINVKSVTPYTITYKLYHLLYSVLIIVNSSIMPLIGKEVAEGNWQWLNKTYNNFLVLVAFLGGLTWLGGVLFARDFVYLWVGPQGYAGLTASFFLGGYSYLMIVINLNSLMLSSLNYLKKLPAASWLESILNIGLSIWLLKYFGLGGVAMGTFLGALLAPAWIFPILVKRGTNNKVRYNYSFIIKQFLFFIVPALLTGVMIQLHIQSLYIRLISSFFVITFYIVGVFKILPVNTNNFLIEHVVFVFEKIGLRKIGAKLKAFKK